MLFFITPHSSQGFSYTFSPTFTFSRFCDPFFFLCLKPLAHSLLMASMLGGLHSCSHSVFPDWANVGLTGLVNDTFAAILIRSPTELEERRPQGCRASGLQGCRAARYCTADGGVSYQDRIQPAQLSHTFPLCLVSACSFCLASFLLFPESVSLSPSTTIYYYY